MSADRQAEYSDMRDPAYRKVMELHISQFHAIRAEVMGIAADLSKWLLAALLSLNGGGLVALISLEGAPSTIPLSAAAAFLAGVVCAAGSAYLLLITVSRLTSKLWAASDPEAIVLRSRFESMRDIDWEEDRTAREVAIALLLNGGSLTCFVSGAVTAAVELL
jgi:hypothetical protein